MTMNNWEYISFVLLTLGIGIISFWFLNYLTNIL